MHLTDRELGEQLYAFMRVVPYFWSWEDLMRMLKNHETHVEYRGPPDHLISFSLQAQQHHAKGEEDWLEAVASLSDPDRGHELAGSYFPLLGSVVMHRDGKVELSSLGNGTRAPESFQPPNLVADIDNWS